MSLVRSDKTNNGTTRRVTRSQSTSTNIESLPKNSNNINIENEKEIINQTYGNIENLSLMINNPSIPKEIISEPQPVVTNTIPIIDKDIVMGNTEVFEITSSSPQKLLTPVITPHVILDESIHNSRKGKSVLRNSNNTNQNNHNDFTTLYTTLTAEDQQSTAINELINVEFNDANKIFTLSI
ncbi:hypothetical protein C1645_738546 [Glomus cerebriforme]|uniref:Uncharacterized protein n=1 Tax=Glomus cerebriforme TaxID=658196 RepID=A0A397SUC1_9GLOM|nr:hypothetical protein C1645_738546 [Glomus cerebriforme]